LGASAEVWPLIVTDAVGVGAIGGEGLALHPADRASATVTEETVNENACTSYLLVVT